MANEVEKNILIDIQLEIKEETGEDLSLQEIEEVVGSQFKIANRAFKKAVSVKLPYFGTFEHRDSYAIYLLSKELADRKDSLTDEEYKKELAIVKEKVYKIGKKRASRITLEEFNNIPDIVKVKNKYDGRK